MNSNKTEKVEKVKNIIEKDIQSGDLFSNFSISIAIFVGFQILNKFSFLDFLKTKYFYSYSIFYIVQMIVYIAASSISIVNLISIFLSSQNWENLIFSKIFDNSNISKILSQIPINKVNKITYSNLENLVSEDFDDIEKFPNPFQLHNLLSNFNSKTYFDANSRKIYSIKLNVLNSSIPIYSGRLASTKNAEKLSSSVKKSILQLITVMLIGFFCYSVSLIYSNLNS
jgi:hypothetical protein